MFIIEREFPSFNHCACDGAFIARVDTVDVSDVSPAGIRHGMQDTRQADIRHGKEVRLNCLFHPGAVGPEFHPAPVDSAPEAAQRPGLHQSVFIAFLILRPCHGAKITVAGRIDEHLCGYGEKSALREVLKRNSTPASAASPS